MEDNFFSIIPFKNISFDETDEKLFKILGDNKLNKNILLKNILEIISFLENNTLITQEKLNLFIQLNLNYIENLSIDIILEFLQKENLIEINNEIISLTGKGKIFQMSDEVSNNLDLIRFFYEKCDLNLLFKDKHNKYLQKEARRYIACLLTQADDEDLSIEGIREKYKELDDFFTNKYTLYNNLISDKSFGLVLQYIFEPLGILKLIKKQNEIILKLTDCGRKIFEYYSFDIEEEYRRLIDESWDNYDKGNFQEAFDIAKSIISVSGNSPDAYNIIGCVYIKLKEYEKAIAVFKYTIDLCEEKIIFSSDHRTSITDTYISVYYNLGLSYYFTGDFILALKVLMILKKTVPYRIENVENIIETIKKIIIVS